MKIIKRIDYVILMSLLIFSFCSCGGKTEMKSHFSSDEFKSRNYEQVLSELKKVGFQNFEYEILSDLTSDDHQLHGTIESVSFDGKSEYDISPESEMDLSSVVVKITYHVIPEVVIPFDSKEVNAYSLEELQEILLEAGFVNVKAEEIYDLDPDENSADYVIEVSIGDDVEFDKGDLAFFDVSVLVIKHLPYVKYDVKINIDFIPNLLFSKYDVIFKVNGENHCTLEHGKDKTIDLRLEEGSYEFLFESAESQSVNGSVQVELNDDIEISYKIFCFSDRINVELVSTSQESKQDIDSEISSGGSEDETNLTEEFRYDIDKDLFVVMCEKDEKYTTMYKIVFAEENNGETPKVYYTFDSYKNIINPGTMGKEFSRIGPLPNWFYVGALVHVKANLNGEELSTVDCIVTPAKGDNKENSPELNSDYPTEDGVEKETYLDKIHGKEVFERIIKGEVVSQKDSYSLGDNDYEFQADVNRVSVRVFSKGENGSVYYITVNDLLGTGNRDVFFKVVDCIFNGDDLKTVRLWLDENLGGNAATKIKDINIELGLTVGGSPTMILSDDDNY